METKEVLEYQWPYLLSFFPTDIELDKTAREYGALRRKRQITEASDLLRLALAYGFCQMSLRQTAAWAEMIGLADISDVALLKRLRSASDWLGFLVGRKLADRAKCRNISGPATRLRVVDATVVNGPNSNGTEWRVHLGLDLAHLSINHIELTDASGGEQLGRFAFEPGDLEHFTLISLRRSEKNSPSDRWALPLAMPWRWLRVTSLGCEPVFDAGSL